jgi:outer membrane protein
MRAARAPRGVPVTLLASASLLVMPPAVAAQATPSDPLTLQEALRLAEGSNPAYRRATNDAGLNRVAMRTTWLSQLLPSASLTLATQYDGNLRRFAQDEFGYPVERPDAPWSYFSSTTQVLGLSWNVQGPSLFQAYRRQRLENARRDLVQQNALTDVQLEVQQLYLDALEQRALAESASELLEARRVELGVAERLFAVGTKTRVEVLSAELEVERQVLALQRQESDHAKALLELQTALGVEAGDLGLADEELPIFDPSFIDADALVDRALDLNPELRESEVAISTAEVAVDETGSTWWPQLDAGINVYRRAQLPNTEGLFEPAFDRSFESNFFIRLSLPLFNSFFEDREAHAEARVQLQNEIETRRETRLGVERTVRGAVLVLDNEWASLRIAERSSEIAQEALRLAQERYRLGTGSFEELRTSARNEADTRSLEITARHAFVEALLDLELAVGGSVRPPSGG